MERVNNLYKKGWIIILMAILCAITFSKVYNVSASKTIEQEKLNYSDIKVILYTQSYCPYCKYAKNLLNKHNIKYEAIEIGDNEALAIKLWRQTGQKTVPYVFLNDEFIGGYTELKKKLEQN